MPMRRTPILPAGGVTLALVTLTACAATRQADPQYDLVVRAATIYDGAGGKPFVGDVAVRGDRIVYVGPRADGIGRKELAADGLALAPGFINVLSQAETDLVDDPAGQSDLRQGVTLEVLNEGVSPGPATPEIKAELERARGRPFPFDWQSLGDYMVQMERRGLALNVATYVGAGTVRENVLGAQDVAPDAAQLDRMRALVKASMEEGAVGLSSGLIYVPGVYARQDELVALARESGRCGGLYISHIRSEGDLFLPALDELIAISREAATPAEVFHIKVGGEKNWANMKIALDRIDAARNEGLRITADMYPYPASGTGLDAAMPPWVQEGGEAAWIERLKDPEIRTRVIADMRDPNPDWENVLRGAGGGEGALLAGFKTDRLKPLAGKTLAQVAAERGVTVEDAAIDLVIEDNSRIEVIYFTMLEDNLRLQIQKPYVSIASDGPALSEEGEASGASVHPRAYGAFARVLARYVREDRLLSLEEAVRRMTSLPANNLGLRDRGLLKTDYVADMVLFDPARIEDRATYVAPHQYAAGVVDVIVNGTPVLLDGALTAARPGRFVRGRAWSGWPDGGCRASSADWRW